MAKVYGKSVVEQYLDRNRRSQELSERARAVLPGGVTRTSVYFDPYPPYIERGEGCRVTDVDGNERIDFSNNYTALILGHGHPGVVAAVQAQVARGSAFAAPTRHEITLAERIIERVPSVERIRFASSGTEAVMFALRLAKAFTGRSKIAKAEGGFHGTSEYASISVSPDVANAGPSTAPASVPATRGITDRVVDEVVVFPFNDADAADALIARHRHDLAAVIVEPVLGSSG